MLNFLVLLFLSTLAISFSISCTTNKNNKKKKSGGSHKKKGGSSNSTEDPPSKKCNTKGGLLADDPDLRSLKLRTKQKTDGGGDLQSNATSVAKPQSAFDGTDLKSFDDGTKKKPVTAIPAAQQPPDQIDPKEISKYAGNKKSATNNDDGMSMLAMAKVDKEKLPAKMAQKEGEVIAQDSTQREENSKSAGRKPPQQKEEKESNNNRHNKESIRNNSSKVNLQNKNNSNHSFTGKASKKGSIRGGGGAATPSAEGGTKKGSEKNNAGGEGKPNQVAQKKKKNVEDVLDAMMDGTQEDEAPAAVPASPVVKSGTPVAPKTKIAEVKTQVATKLLELESGGAGSGNHNNNNSEKKKKLKKTSNESNGGGAAGKRN